MLLIQHHPLKNYIFWLRIIITLACVNALFETTGKPIRSEKLSAWPHNGSFNITDYVLPERDTVMMEPHNICRDKIFLLIIVCSRVENFGARQNIRETWGNTTEFNYHLFSQLHQHFEGKYSNPSLERLEFYRDYIMGESSKLYQSNMTTVPSSIPVRVVFLVGRRKNYSLISNYELRLRNESSRYDDIIQENFIDNYKNLTVKSVMALKWINTRHCQHTCAFILKCDDDAFVNIPNVLHFLLGGTIPLYSDVIDLNDPYNPPMLTQLPRFSATHNLLMGHLFCSARPIADITSKWYMPYYMYPGHIYPKYLSGAAYLMSSDVVPKLYEAALNTPIIYLEDVYITGICAEHIKLDRHHNPLFTFKRYNSPCTMKGTLTQHRFKNDNLMTMYALLADLSVQCVLAESSSLYQNLNDDSYASYLYD